LIGYIIIGICLGEHGFDMFADKAQVEFLGELGIILLFFFIGMEISLPSFVNKWKVAILGTLSQILISVGIMALVGYFLDWKSARSIVIGFVIALSSSAVVIKLLENKKLLNTTLGDNVLSILLTQDIMIAPILIVTSLLGGSVQTVPETITKILGGGFVFFMFFYLYIKKEIKLPYVDELEEDHELQVFLAILLCAAGALITSLFGLSPALGAFIGGMVVHASKDTDWIHESLHPFRILFIALFFISVGAQINIYFLEQHKWAIMLVLLIVFLTNHAINAIILRVFDCSWKDAFLGGALLAQIGEMSFLVCFTGYQSSIISEFGYMFSLCIISLSLLISPFWIAATEKLLLRIK
jgi:CPA2 family monovalent cation:H+ antiporter-2